jgi:tetratricopeptide (TPR) repeat protein
MSNGIIKKMIERARKYFDSGKYLHSLQIYHRIINEYPGYVDAYSELAYVYTKLGKEGYAEKLLRKALQIEPGNEEVLFLLGTNCLRSKKFDEAIKFLTKLAYLEYPAVHYNLGLAYYYRGDYLEAEAELKKVLSLDPDFPKAVESLAEILIKRESYDEAVDFLKRGIKKEPYNHTLYYLLGISFWNLGKLKQAREAIETAIDLEPNNGVLWQTCGEILLELGEIEKAEKYFNRAISLDKGLVDSFINLGLIHLYRGEDEQARKFFDEAIKIDPKASVKIEEKIKLLRNG